MNFVSADQPCGHNFGWDHNEGAHCYPPEQDNCLQAGELPVANYSHGDNGCSITGIGVYRGQTSPDLDGIYFNSDYCSGRIFGLVQGDDGSWTYQIVLDSEVAVTGAGQSADGELYLTSCECVYGNSYDPLADPSGAVWQIVQQDQVPSGAEIAPSTPQATPAGSVVSDRRVMGRVTRLGVRS